MRRCGSCRGGTGGLPIAEIIRPGNVTTPGWLGLYCGHPRRDIGFMSEVNRRDFVKAGAGAAALTGITFITKPERVFGANDRVRVATCGVRGRGWDHIRGFNKLT